jgi:hypothetical protein
MIFSQKWGTDTNFGNRWKWGTDTHFGQDRGLGLEIGVCPLFLLLCLELCENKGVIHL